MTFWILAIVIAGLVGALIALAMGRSARGVAPAAGYDMQVYRDQLAEVERDVARGVVSDEEAERVRIEVSRRLLEADREAAATEGLRGGSGNMLWGAAVGLVVLVGTFFIYGQLGAPGYQDVPLKERIANSDAARADRPLQAEVEAKVDAVEIDPNIDPRMADLMVKLREALKGRPDDLQGHMLLARNEAGMGNFVAAYEAQAQVIAIKGDQVTAKDYADQADMMILAAGGYVSPEAETALSRALNLDRGNGTALYYSGLMFAQSGRADLSFRIWSDLLADSAPDDPWVSPIREQIELVAVDAGVQYTLPPLAETRGPTGEDIEAASDMSEEDREGMIRGMVEGLSARLANDGGTAAEWAQLIGALGVLGETDRARAIFGEAQVVFGARPEDLATVRAAAERAGVIN